MGCFGCLSFKKRVQDEDQANDNKKQKKKERHFDVLDFATVFTIIFNIIIETIRISLILIPGSPSKKSSYLKLTLTPIPNLTVPFITNLTVPLNTNLTISLIPNLTVPLIPNLTVTLIPNITVPLIEKYSDLVNKCVEFDSYSEASYRIKWPNLITLIGELLIYVCELIWVTSKFKSYRTKLAGLSIPNDVRVSDIFHYLDVYRYPFLKSRYNLLRRISEQHYETFDLAKFTSDQKISLASKPYIYFLPKGSFNFHELERHISSKDIKTILMIILHTITFIVTLSSLGFIEKVDDHIKFDDIDQTIKEQLLEIANISDLKFNYYLSIGIAGAKFLIQLVNLCYLIYGYHKTSKLIDLWGNRSEVDIDYAEFAEDILRTFELYPFPWAQRLTTFKEFHDHDPVKIEVNTKLLEKPLQPFMVGIKSTDFRIESATTNLVNFGYTTDTIQLLDFGDKTD